MMPIGQPPPSKSRRKGNKNAAPPQIPAANPMIAPQIASQTGVDPATLSKVVHDIQHLPRERLAVFHHLFQDLNPRDQSYQYTIQRMTQGYLSLIGHVLSDFQKPQSILFERASRMPHPMVFSRGRLIFFRVQGTLGPFYIDRQEFTRQKDTEVIGSFWTLRDIPLSEEGVRVVVDGKPIEPRSFGDHESVWYSLGKVGDALNPKITLQISVHQNHCMWFVVQYVTFRATIDIVKDICVKGSYQIADGVTSVFGRTHECPSTCKFDVMKKIVEIQGSGDCSCPFCGERIVLGTLKLDLKQKTSEEEEKPEVRIAKGKMYDAFFMTVCLTKMEPDWSSILFKEDFDWNDGDVLPEMPDAEKKSGDYLDYLENLYDEPGGDHF
jgi:hypothetical protein